MSPTVVAEEYESHVDEISEQIFGEYQKLKPEQKAVVLKKNLLGYLIEKNEQGQLVLPDENVIETAFAKVYATSVVSEKTSEGIVGRLKESIAEVKEKAAGALFYELRETKAKIALPYNGEAQTEDPENAYSMVMASMENDSNALAEVSGKLTSIRDQFRAADDIVVQMDTEAMPKTRDGGYQADGTTMYKASDALADVASVRMNGSADLLQRLSTEEVPESTNALVPQNESEEFAVAVRDMNELATSQKVLYKEIATGSVLARGEAVNVVANFTIDSLEEQVREEGVDELSDERIAKATGMDKFKAAKMAEAKQASKGKGLIIKG